MSHRSFPSSARYWRLRNLLLTALFICVTALGVKLLDSLPGSSSPFQAATVTYVVDGDTLYAAVDGRRTKIRLIGIDTPESVSRTKANTPEGDAAAEYLRELLSPGDEIYLEFDEEEHDQYGRTLAYVWLRADADSSDFDDFCRYNLSAVIYQNTYCRLLHIPPNTKYAAWFGRLTPYD